MDKCPDCKGELEKGCMIDHGYGVVITQRYAKADISEGPEKLFIYETDFNDVRRVITYRCTKCNRLFQYAQNFVIVPNLGERNRNFMIISLGIAIVFVIFLFLLIFLVAE